MKTIKIVPPAAENNAVVYVRQWEEGGKSFSKFESLAALFMAMRFRVSDYGYFSSMYGDSFWVLDAKGDVIPKGRFWAAYRKHIECRRERFLARLYNWQPGSRRARGSYQWLRSFKTMNETRQYVNYVDEFRNVGLTPKSRRNNLPNSWDDLHRFRPRSWKSQRKTQYKTKGV